MMSMTRDIRATVTSNWKSLCSMASCAMIDDVEVSRDATEASVLGGGAVDDSGAVTALDDGGRLCFGLKYWINTGQEGSNKHG